MVRILRLVMLLLILAAAVVGWKMWPPTEQGEPAPPEAEATEPRQIEQTEKIQGEERKVQVELYFSDANAMHLVPEERMIILQQDQSLAEEVLEELIAGPRSDGMLVTVPSGTRILSVKVENGIAYVNLSKEYQSEHWGGSSGDLLTTYSIVNTLTRLPGIAAVQFLLEGKTCEAILGHMDTSRPLEFNSDLIR